jgi:CRP-like cAMP-binding protein
MQNLINAISAYVSLNNKDISIIEQLFAKKELKKNEYFLQPGKICNEFAFVDKGFLRHYISHEEAEETFYFSAENDFVCDYNSFIDRTPSIKYIAAIEHTTLYSISYINMQKFYSDVSTGERFGRLFLESIFSKAINHIISTHTDDAEQRYLNFLKSFSHIQQRIPQYYIASFIGVTPQSLSRIRKRMAEIPASIR